MKLPAFTHAHAARTCFIALLTCSAGCNAARAEQPRVVDKAIAIAVEVQPIERGDIAHPIFASGLVGARREVDLGFKVGGVVARVLVEVGSKVHKGQLLATLDATEYAAAGMQASEALSKAERDLARAELLNSRDSLPMADVQNARTAVQLARASVTATQFNTAHAQLLAPADGVIDRRSLEPGETLAPGRPVLHMSHSQSGWVVRAALPEADASGLKLGDACVALLGPRNAAAADCEVAELASSANPATGLFEVVAQLKHHSALARSGAFAKLQIARNVRLASVSTLALVDGRGEQAAVFVPAGDKAKRVPVRIAFLYGSRAAIADGLGDEARVIERGSSQLRDGATFTQLAH